MTLVGAVVVVVLLTVPPSIARGQAGRRDDVLDVNTTAEQQVPPVPGATRGLVRGASAAGRFRG